MQREVELPGASELFRATSHPGAADQPKVASPHSESSRNPTNGTGQTHTGAAARLAVDSAGTAATRQVVPKAPDGADASGRVRHDEKITVYVSTDELINLEQARLVLRAEHGIGVDRGRLVREAVAMLVEDLNAHGHRSRLVQRLSS